jgi:hypothetical protein
MASFPKSGQPVIKNSFIILILMPQQDATKGEKGSKESRRKGFRGKAWKLKPLEPSNPIL